MDTRNYRSIVGMPETSIELESCGDVIVASAGVSFSSASFGGIGGMTAAYVIHGAKVASSILLNYGLAGASAGIITGAFTTVGCLIASRLPEEINEPAQPPISMGMDLSTIDTTGEGRRSCWSKLWCCFNRENKVTLEDEEEILSDDSDPDKKLLI